MSGIAKGFLDVGCVLATDVEISRFSVTKLNERLIACGASSSGHISAKTQRLKSIMLAKREETEALAREAKQAAAVALDKRTPAIGVRGDQSVISVGKDLPRSNAV